MEDRRLVREILGVEGIPVSREPLCDGAISGYAVPDGDAERRWYLDTSGRRAPGDTSNTANGSLFTQDGRTVRTWEHPNDPWLPALPAAAQPELARLLLASIGLPAPERMEMLGYRPGRRAVFRMLSEDHECYVKILPPADTAATVERHTALAAAGLPLPELLGWGKDGIVVLDDARGEHAPNIVGHLPPEVILDAIDELRASLHAAPITVPARASLATSVAWYLKKLGEAMPERNEQLMTISDTVLPTAHGTTAKPVVIHGDLHIAQLFFRDAEITGVIDTDTAGLGDPDDDSAVFVANALSSALANETIGNDPGAIALGDLADAADARWLTTSHARALTAVHLLAHAHRTFEQRDVERTGQLVDFAEMLAANTRAH